MQSMRFLNRLAMLESRLDQIKFRHVYPNMFCVLDTVAVSGAQTRRHAPLNGFDKWCGRPKAAHKLFRRTHPQFLTNEWTS